MSFVNAADEASRFSVAGVGVVPEPFDADVLPLLFPEPLGLLLDLLLDLLDLLLVVLVALLLLVVLVAGLDAAEAELVVLFGLATGL